MFKNFIWSFGERIIAQVVTLVVSIILARILLPAEFGVVSLVMIFITLANVIVSDGFGSALVQKIDSDEIDFSTIFWFSEFVSIVLYTIIFFTAPLIAHYYDMSILTPVLRVMGLRLPLAALNSIQRARVSKDLAFKKFFFSTIIGTVISGFIGVFMAVKGFGVWSIVFQYLSNCLIDSLILFFTCGWKPKFLFKYDRLKPLASFGWRILTVSLMNSLYGNLRNLVIGKRYSSEELGYSKKAESFPNLVSVNISSSVVSVLFPTLTKIQEDRSRVLELSRKFVQICSFLMVPILFGLAAISDEVVEILLTSKWLPCVPYMQILCIVYLFQPIQQASLQALKALGKSKKYLVLEIIKKLFGILVLIISVVCFRSVVFVIFGALIAELFSTLVNFPINKKLFGYSYKHQFFDILNSLIGGIFMWWFVYCLKNHLGLLIDSNLITMIICIFIGAIVYFGYSIVFNKKCINYTKEIVKNVFGKA